MYTLVTHFTDKYGYELGTDRGWRYKEIALLLKKSEDLLIQKGIMVKKTEGYEIDDDFLEYLLATRLDKETGRIPEDAVGSYLQTKNIE